MPDEPEPPELEQFLPLQKRIDERVENLPADVEDKLETIFGDSLEEKALPDNILESFQAILQDPSTRAFMKNMMADIFDIGEPSIGTLLKKTIAIIYQDHQAPQQCTDTTYKIFKKHPPSVQLFISERFPLLPRQTGTILANGQPLRLSPIQYRVLTHLLKYHQEPKKRHLADLIDHCWDRPNLAQQVRQNPKRLLIGEFDPHPYDKAINQLNKKLSTILNTRAVPKKSIYALKPLPKFLLLEEHTE